MRNETALRFAEGSMMARKVWFVVALAMCASACVPDYVKQNDGDINLLMGSVNGGTPLQSDVFTPPSDRNLTGVTPDLIIVSLANRLKNPLGNPTTILANAVLFERYEVRYIRSDGRQTEGVDVPFRITGPLSGAIDVASSGTTNVPLEVVRAQAKLEAPLRNLRAADADLNVAPPGGAIILTCIAEITVYGRTVGGQAVSATGRLQIDFADWQ